MLFESRSLEGGVDWALLGEGNSWGPCNQLALRMTNEWLKSRQSRLCTPTSLFKVDERVLDRPTICCNLLTGSDHAYAQRLAAPCCSLKKTSRTTVTTMSLDFSWICFLTIISTAVMIRTKNLLFGYGFRIDVRFVFFQQFGCEIAGHGHIQLTKWRFKNIEKLGKCKICSVSNYWWMSPSHKYIPNNTSMMKSPKFWQNQIKVLTLYVQLVAPSADELSPTAARCDLSNWNWPELEIFW